jgi:RND superfamily putative drug exporter
MVSGRISSTPFRRLGTTVYRRRRYVIVVWLIALVLVVPLILNEGKVSSLNQGGTIGIQPESAKAASIISAEFSKTVANSTLLVVVSTNNASSPETQALIRGLVSSLKSDKNIHGLNQTVDVYSALYSAIGGANKGAFAALKGANGTSHLLLGVPALYLGAWEQAFGSTRNVTASNAAANETTALTLDKANSTAYRLYSSHVLVQFYSAWQASWMNPVNSNLTAVARASVSAMQADAQYLSTYARGTRAFSETVLQAITFSDFISDNRTQANQRLESFATGYVANSTAFSRLFVAASYDLGRTYDNSSLYKLAGNIVWKPSAYAVGPAFTTLISSFVSPGRDTTLVSLGLNQSSDPNLLEIRSKVQAVFSGLGVGTGVQSAAVTGQDAISYDFGQSTQADLGIILPLTIALLIVATGIFFRSFLTPFITLGTIGVALGISQVFIVLVGTFVAKVDFTIPTILLTILIGVGTDYSVFVIARYREERVNGSTVEEAVETSVTWAGESIATSGATVIISFLALTLTSVVYLRTIGLVVGLGVLVALSVALTLVPAIISVTGGRTFWPTSGVRFERYSASVISKLERKRGYFSRSGAFAVKRAKILIVLAIMVTIPAVYAYSTTTPTYDFLSAAPASLESVAASNHLTQSFGGGRLFPTYVVVTFNQPLVSGHSFDSSEMGTLESIASHLASSPDVRNVTGPTRPYGDAVTYSNLNLSRTADARTFASIMQSVGKDNRTALVTINFGIDPYSSQAISDAQSIRQYLHSNYDSMDGVTGIYEGGASGTILDTKNVFDSQFNSVVPIVAVGVALVLLVVLGSLFLPIFAVFSVLMSIVWTLGATRLIFQQYFNYQLLFITPFFLFVTLLGLGMDYNIFILTRIREDATKGKPLNDAIITAIEQTGGIITAAAIILAGSLGALMVSSDLLLKQIGFSFAYSILIDALIVRTYLVPAVMSTMGRWNWYSPIPFLNRSHFLYEQAKRNSTAS